MIKIIEWLKKTDHLKVPHKGTVLDNDDPKKLGRVKVQITALLEGTSDTLPWVYPVNAFGLGGNNESSSFSVPEIGSELEILFPYDDIYFPFYRGYWQSVLNHQSDFDEDYPDTYGFRDSTGNIFKINKAQNYVDVLHASGLQIHVDAAGNLTMTIPENDDKTVGGNKKVTVTGTFDVDAQGHVTIKTNDLFDVDAQGHATIKSNDKIDLDGGSASPVGVVQGDCMCPFTGRVHIQISNDVKASLG